MKKALMLTGLVIAIGYAGFANAADEQEPSISSSSAKAAEIAPLPVEQTQKDIDQEITNAKLRAQLGSKSKWSVKTAVNYNGGSIESPGASVRPAYLGGNSSPIDATMSGTVGVKYSASAHDSFTLNTGVSVNDPLHGDMSRSTFKDPLTQKSVNRADVYNPSLVYDRAYKVGSVQNITELVGTSYTQPFYTQELNLVGALDLSQTMVGEIPNSNWSMGITLDSNYTGYNSTKPSLFMARNGISYTDLEFGVYPFVEYSFNSRFSFRTLIGQYADRVQNTDAYIPTEIYQSMGIGISITRDIYLYPNIQFLPGNARSDLTNVALSTNISVF